MGRLNDLAKNQSKFVSLSIGESDVFEFVSFLEVPSKFDPEKTSIQYKFTDVQGNTKFWTNGSALVMRVMDKMVKGDRVEISRLEFLDKDGNVVQGKSSWKVAKVGGGTL